MCFFRKNAWTRVIAVVIDHPKCLMSSFISAKRQPFFVAFSNQGWGRLQSLLSNIKSVITGKEPCVPRFFRCMLSTGIKRFLRNVSLGNLRLKKNVFLILVGLLRSIQLSPGKAWRPFATSISDLSFLVMWHRWDEGVFDFRHFCWFVLPETLGNKWVAS